jgi:hypothetical protein
MNKFWISPLCYPLLALLGLQARILLPNRLNSLTLDFDAAESIVEQGNGGYLLKPVIRPL